MGREHIMATTIRSRRGGDRPGRCPSTVSVGSRSSTDIDDDTTDDSRFRRRRLPENNNVDGDDSIDGDFSVWRVLSFDPLDLRSTSWRDRRMSSSSSSSSSYSRVVRHHYGAEVRFFSPPPGGFHYPPEELELHRRVGDPEVDSLLEHLASDADADAAGGGGGCGAFDDVVARASDEYRLNTNSPSCVFYRHYRENVPDWVDFDRIQRGIDVFLAYLPAAGCALFHRSLVGGFSIPRIARVLVATRYLVPSSPGAVAAPAAPPDDGDRRRSAERLLDTGGFLACCFAPPAPPPSSSPGGAPAPAPAAASLRPGGRGWEAALRVRILHAKVRRSLLLRGRSGAENDAWDVDENGVPINQEDMAATLLAFSVNVLLGIEISAGRPLDAHDQRDYLALWRYLGWLLGVDTPEGRGGCGGSSNPPGGVDADGGRRRRRRLAPIDPCGPRRLGGVDRPDNDDDDDDVDRPDNDPVIHSYATLESMVLHLLHPDATSRYLVNHLLGLGRSSVVFRSEVCRKFLGDPLSDELGIARSRASWSGWRWASLRDISSHLWVKFLLYVFLVVLRGYTLLTMTCPWFRRRAIAWHGSLEGRFLRVWDKSHEGRVTEASSKRKGSTSKSTNTKSSHCPFAMIMDPVVDNVARR